MSQSPRSVEQGAQSVNTGSTACTAKKIPFMYSFSGNSAASVPISTFICLWRMYIFPRLIHLFEVRQSAMIYFQVELSEFLCALQRQNAENLKQIFPEKEYRGLSPNFHIHVSVSELYIPTMSACSQWTIEHFLNFAFITFCSVSVSQRDLNKN